MWDRSIRCGNLLRHFRICPFGIAHEDALQTARNDSAHIRQPTRVFFPATSDPAISSCHCHHLPFHDQLVRIGSDFNIALCSKQFSCRHLFGVQSALPSAPKPGSMTYFEDIQAWIADFIDDSYIFVTSAGFGQSPYNPHIWTIAEELRGSVIVYTTLLVHFALGYGPRCRFWANLALFCYFQFLVDGSNYALFVMGMLICDIQLALELNPDQVPRLFKVNFFERHNWIFYLLLLFGLYLGSGPDISDPANLSGEPGWSALAYLVPPAAENAMRYFCAFSGVRRSQYSC